jgi:magnesium-transporting ATPase (P-type)
MLTTPHSKQVEQVLAALDSGRLGLAIDEATNRFEQFGPNRLPRARHISFTMIFLRQFLDPLIYVLLAAALLSFFIGKFIDAVFIFGVLLVNALIGAIQERSAQRSAASLQELVTSMAKVQRAGEVYEIDAEHLVPGDIVLLESGDKVPADLRLINSNDVQVDESLLSGESLPVLKKADTVLAEEIVVADRINMLFSGTLLVRGRAMGVVTATALQTELGHIAEDVLQRERVKPPLLQRMDRFTFRLTIVMGIAILALAVVTLVRGMPWVDVFLLSAALAVSTIPEGLPVAMTVALAISIRRMARRHVIARRLATVEALGSCTFIASDKTGTLTRNEISVQEIALPGQAGFVLPITRLLERGEQEQFNAALPAEQLPGLLRLARAMALANEGFLGHRNGSWVRHGDSVDTALLVMAKNLGMTQAEELIASPLKAMIPFESGQRYTASLHQANEDDEVFVKGAVETILPMCANMATASADLSLQTQTIIEQAQGLAGQGYRVLAAAAGRLEPRDEEHIAEDELRGLTFLGLVGMIDPLRDESRQAIAACHAAGIEVAMLTGDHPLTAFAIAKDLGFVENLSQVVTPKELAGAANEPRRYAEMLRDTRVYARLEPHQKLDIVSALQQGGHFVAVTGDGANDAPALRAAHVGVAMGQSGTDVARETADIILTDDNFTSIVAGIEEGRIAYSNVRKVIHLLISTGAAEIVLFFLSLLFSLPIPLTAVQLLWLNLVTNGIQDVALAFEPGEGDELKRPPRAPRESIFNRVMIQRVLLAASVMGSVAFITFYTLLKNGASVEEARNLTLLLMVLFENIHVFNSRSETRSVFLHNPLQNGFLLLSVIGAQSLHILAMFIPGLKDVLQVSPVSFSEWFYLLLLAMSLLLASEVYKFVSVRR